LELELIPIIGSTRKPALAIKGENPSTADIPLPSWNEQGWDGEIAGDDPPSWNCLMEPASLSNQGVSSESVYQPARNRFVRHLNPRAALVGCSAPQCRRWNRADCKRGGPYNDIGAVPLQLHRERYVGMTHYFESIGPSGVRMMRQLPRYR